ncbi:MAG: hypothetical protein QNJ31_04855 [Candidatus Caenarcaniphilales bacterium]|nr:hypothetical protein [Candidatus Caenarcaniphilales bacterium]
MNLPSELLVESLTNQEFIINFTDTVFSKANNLNSFSDEVFHLVDYAKNKNFKRIVVIDRGISSTSHNENNPKQNFKDNLSVVIDHINLATLNPLIGPNDNSKGERFFALNNLYIIPEELKELDQTTIVGINPNTKPNKEEVGLLVSSLNSNTLGIEFSYNLVQTSLIAAHRKMQVIGLIYKG